MNLVFTSVGDNTNFDNLWLGKNKTYDVYVIYYGDNDDIYKTYRTPKGFKIPKFSISKKYDLDICGPSFDKTSKISHPFTRHKPNTLLTYTNFVEVNTMLLNKNALHNLMKYMIPELIGWGIDFLAIWANGITKKNKYAIIHSVKCINPIDTMKNISCRELYKIDNSKSRSQIYYNYIKELGI